MMYYRQALKYNFNVIPDISKHIERFEAFEKKLRDLYVPPRDYAFTVVHMLRGWVKDKGFEFLPVNVFLGSWAFNKYMKQHNSEYVDIQYDCSPHVLLYDELNVARLYIQERGRRLCFIVEELRPLLSMGWIESYKIGSRPVQQALDVLRFEFNVLSATSYNDIIEALV